VIAPVLVGHYLLRRHRPNVKRRFRLPNVFKWVALALAAPYFVVWLGGGIAYSFIGDQAIYYFLGWLVAACYLPLYWYRRREDRRLADDGAGATQPAPTVAAPADGASPNGAPGGAAGRRGVVTRAAIRARPPSRARAARCAGSCP
jgi:hypothetical protein